MDLNIFRDKFNCSFEDGFSGFIGSDKFNVLVRSNGLVVSPELVEVLRLAYFQGGSDSMRFFKVFLADVIRKCGGNPFVIAKAISEFKG